MRKAKRFKKKDCTYFQRKRLRWNDFFILVEKVLFSPEKSWSSQQGRNGPGVLQGWGAQWGWPCPPGSQGWEQPNPSGKEQQTPSPRLSFTPLVFPPLLLGKSPPSLQSPTSTLQLIIGILAQCGFFPLTKLGLLLCQEYGQQAVFSLSRKCSHYSSNISLCKRGFSASLVKNSMEFSPFSSSKNIPPKFLGFENRW